jgi:hypothetical protein
VVEKLNRGTTLHADHVIVVFVIKQMLVTGNAVSQVDLSCEAAFHEDLHGAIHGRIADAGILLLDAPVDIFDTPVPFIIEERIQDQFAMRSHLQVSLPKVVGENLHFGPDRLHGPEDVGSIFTTSL